MPSIFNGNSSTMHVCHSRAPFNFKKKKKNPTKNMEHAHYLRCENLMMQHVNTENIINILP